MALAARNAFATAALLAASGNTRASAAEGKEFGEPWSKPVKPNIYVYDVPSCARADTLLSSLPGDDGKPVPLSEQANALYLRKIAAQLRPLHRQLIQGSSSGAYSLTSDSANADLFYVPALFSVLFWIGSSEALNCVASTFQLLKGHPSFLQRNGKDHMILYGVEFSHYRAKDREFSLDYYDASAANWIVLTVACPRPCGKVPDTWSARSRFVVIPHASRMDCRRGGPSWTQEAKLLLSSEGGYNGRRFLLGFVGALGPGKDHPERHAFFELTCSSDRWLRTEDGVWHQSGPWTGKHWVLDSKTTVVDAFLLTKAAFDSTCPARTEHLQWLMSRINFWWIEAEWRWRLVPEADPPDYGAYFRKAFSVPFYSFTDGSLSSYMDDLHQATAKGLQEVLEAGGFHAKRRPQPQFNSLLFETIYGHSEICLILPGDTADCAKRLWDAMVRGCLPAFATAAAPGTWPVLPYAEKVPWSSFGLLFHHVNSTAAAARVLLALSRIPKVELQRRRTIMRNWLPLLVVDRVGKACGGNITTTSTGQPPRSAWPRALDLALEEAAQRSAFALAREHL